MRILILGRDGQVGTALTETLAPLGTVVALGRTGADLSRPETLSAVVMRERPDVVVNAAAHTAVDRAESEPELARSINATSPRVLAEAARDAGAWFIHYSTDYVFDGSKPAPYVETDPTAPLSVYGETKRDGERAVAAAGANALVFRTSWVHAPGGNNFIAKMLSLAQSRDELRVIDDQTGAPTSARLIAEVTRRAILRIRDERPMPAGLYHLTALGETTWNGYARYVIGKAIERGIALKATTDKVLPVPTSAFPTPALRPLNSRLSTEKLRHALGIDLPHWQDDVLGTLDTIIPEPAA
jgi:dTDP-4-dehydrorhamnose reductase